ncbi:MAG: hypothetical protein AB2A00_36825 [Myxococcota bacterium]
MKRAYSLLLATLALACQDPFARQVTLGAEKLSSLDVELVFDGVDRTGCLDLPSDEGPLPDPSVEGDFCPRGEGTPEHKLAFQSGRPVRVNVRVVAIGSQQTRPFGITGIVAVGSNVGTILTGPLNLNNGVSNVVPVRFMDGPGRVQIWAEASTAMRINGERVPPTYSMGTSNVLWFEQPALQDIQRTTDDAVSPLDGKRIEIRGGNLWVTRIAGNGFTVQDLDAQPGVDGKLWNGLFVFAYNGVENLAVGSRLLKLGGAVTEFQGMTQLAEPEFVSVGGVCKPPAPAARYGVEDVETDEGGLARRARCPEEAVCENVGGVDRCIPRDAPEGEEYDRFGRLLCNTAESCDGAASSQCPAGMACMDRAEWNSFRADGTPAHTCQVCPKQAGTELWTPVPATTSLNCYPLYKAQSEESLAARLRNEALEGTLLQINDVTVTGLDLTNDFTRSGFESFGQWKVVFPDGITCVTVVSEAAPDFDVLAANAQRLQLESLTGTLRQVRFKTGSAFWMLDVRHKDDLVVRTPSP